MNCIPTSETCTFTTNILIHATMLFVFLTIFFIFYISKISKEAIEKEVTENIKHSIDKLKKTTVGSKILNIKEIIPDNMSNKLINKYNIASPDITINNKMVSSHAIIISISLIILIVVIWGLLRASCNQCLPIGRLLKENIVLFSFIGIVEFIFFKYVALQYIPIEPSYIVNVAIERLKKTQ